MTLSPKTAEPLEPSNEGVFMVLYEVARLFRRDFQRRARSHATTRAQWQVLGTLDRQEGIRQINLAELLEIEPITLVRHLDRLEEAGLVKRRPDPTDRRARTLHLTPAAKPALSQIRAIGKQSSTIGLSGLTNAEGAELLRLLQLVRKNFSDGAAGEGPAPEKSVKDVSHG